MFYSQFLLSKKGPLGIIWVAAHCHKRLKKEQIKQTDISSSVDKILIDEAPVVTHRILAYLLLGVVRIYSKKVEYLFHDCNSMLAKLGSSGKGANATINSLRAPYHSITMPQRFELDAFDLELLEDQNVDRNASSPQDTMLADVWEREGDAFNFLDKFHYEDDSSFSESPPTASTPVRDVISPQRLKNAPTLSPSQYMSNSIASMDIFSGTGFSLEECLEPMVLDEAEKEQGHSWLSNEECGPSGEKMELLQTQSNFLEEAVPVLTRPPNTQDTPCNEENETAEMQVEYQRTDLVLREEEQPELIRSQDKEKQGGLNQMKVTGMNVSEGREFHRTDKEPVSMSVEVTPGLELPGGVNASTPETIAVHTPAAKERKRVLKKRKCSFDDTIIIPNKVYKLWIDNPSDLICKRRKAPYSVLHAWIAHTNLPQAFLEPLIPCIAYDLRSIECKRELPAKPKESATVPTTQEELAPSIAHGSREASPIAPGTPITHSTVFRPHDDADISLITSEPTSSNERMGKGSSLIEDQEFDLSLINEETNSTELHSQDKDKYSARTSIVARYLYRNFCNRKCQKKDGDLNLSQVLKGKTKKQSARIFYEILVLKTGNCIDVRQEKAYEDIVLMGTPMLKQTFECKEVA